MLTELARNVFHGVRRNTTLTEKQLLTPYYWIPYHLYRSGKAWHPLLVTLELTYLCNLRCQMCSLVVGNMVTKAGQRKNAELHEPGGTLRREVSTEEYLDLITQIADAGVKAVVFTGGEAALRKDILTLVRAVKSRGMQLSMISNGSANPETYRELVRLGLDSIMISVDGTREVHDHIRGVVGSFDRTQVALRTLIDEKKTQGARLPRIKVGCTVSALNQHDLENVVALFEASAIDDLNLLYLHFSTERRDTLTERRVSGPVMHLKDAKLPDPIVGVDTKALAERVTRIKAERDRRRLQVTFSPDLSPEEIALQYTDESFAFANKCFYAWYATRIDPWGQMYPCWIDVRLGDVREHTFLDLWNSQGYRSFRRLIRKHKLLPKCTTCCVLNDKHWSRLPTFRT
jgi:MoaA/NifB/PqqE/SkfB family radical SAM enzyme